ncbi:hypothetical protein BBBOND_0107510 [Babesia bigemina]|uniref:6-Cys domain-containing protein n=1 Tax=Babesia bigemina TaxID=5866 RepID=A0A061D1D9_BABBI|nr:hypothetical protein BBBOND_0107510 [Babesia bigemina]CDR94453.1 hypothetical protein BBBOND_0107510 [Babesia bigemina]|eukprot:XP_012766639.1 hypothetical protein BBBOND_0107510 [Babesia bigemina]
MEVSVDRVTGTPSCVVDPLSVSRIGFLCEGQIEPHDCMISLLDGDGGVVKPPRPRLYWKFVHHRPWVVAQYFDKLAVRPFYGECRCIDPQTSRLKARIEMRSKTDYVCDIASMIFRNRLRPIRGPWCSAVLHPGSTLTIKIPTQPVNSVSIDVDSDGDISEDVSNVPFSQLPSAYEYESEFLPKDLTTLRQRVKHYDFESYDERFYKEVLAGDAIELDLSQMSRGEIKLIYNANKPLALKYGTNSFCYYWKLASTNPNILDKIFAPVVVSFAYNHRYILRGCDRMQRGVFDPEISRKYCSIKLMGSGIGNIYECSLQVITDAANAGIYCGPDEELLPNNCNSVMYDLQSNSVVPYPAFIRKTSAHYFRGFQDLQFLFRSYVPISYACMCVDKRGYESSRLVLGSNNEVTHAYEVNRRTLFDTLLPYISLPWQKVVLLTEESNSSMMVDLHKPRMHSVELDVGTTLLLRCELVFDVPSPVNNEINLVTWLPTQVDEFHYSIHHTFHGSKLIRTSREAVMVSAKGGLQAVFRKYLEGAVYQTLKITSRRNAVIISKDPTNTKRVPLAFVCGKAPEQSSLSSVNGEGSTSGASGDANLQNTKLSDEHNWHVVVVNVETTDPYMQGCGVTYASDELFKPETPKLYDADGREIGCKIDLQAAKEAAFYCPVPYVLDPPNCFNNVFVDGIVKKVNNLSKSLEASRTNHFVTLAFKSKLVGRGETLRQTPPLECRCVTLKGVTLSTIQVENYYAKE